jgi:hypothetical protein
MMGTKLIARLKTMAFTALFAACASPAWAGDAPTMRGVPGITAEREQAAIEFAREHHPELATLIDKLSRENRREYDRAVRELAQTVDRLARLKKQSQPQYELSLAAWKLDSRARLLAARMTMSQDPGLEDELVTVLRDRADVRLREYQLERRRLEDRLKKVDAAIESLADKNLAADKDLQRIKRTLARSRRVAKKPPGLQGKPAPVKTVQVKTVQVKTVQVKTVRPVVAPRPLSDVR